MTWPPPDPGLEPPADLLLEYRARLLERLEAQPEEFAHAVAAVPEAEWHTPRDPAGRSLHQAVAHVRDLEVLAFVPRIRRILAEDHPMLEPFDTHNWSAADYRAGEPMAAILRQWSQARAELVHLLQGLPAEAWTRAGFHPPSGSRTLQWWVERTYSHAREHLKALSLPQS